MKGWALDLGTTNTGLAYWDQQAERARLIELPVICRKPGNRDPLAAPRMIPSATQMLPPQGFLGRLGRKPFFLKRTFWGNGLQKLTKSHDRYPPAGLLVFFLEAPRYFLVYSGLEKWKGQ